MCDMDDVHDITEFAREACCLPAIQRTATTAPHACFMWHKQMPNAKLSLLSFDDTIQKLRNETCQTDDTSA